MFTPGRITDIDARMPLSPAEVAERGIKTLPATKPSTSPGRRVRRPSAQAMKPAPASWRQVSTSICGKSFNASRRPR